MIPKYNDQRPYDCKGVFMFIPLPYNTKQGRNNVPVSVYYFVFLTVQRNEQNFEALLTSNILLFKIRVKSRKR